MAHKRSPDTERAAECQRLVEELGDFTEEMDSWEKAFIADFCERLLKYGESTFVSDNQFDKLSEIYRRIIG
jgi:hypothetical protein